MDLSAIEHLKHQYFHFSTVIIGLILFKQASYKDMHKIVDVLELRPDLSTYGGD